MPGILPMKVIKVGNSAQSRIAQACDRCRSKKIRCDGVRPTCSQCASVGFECKTSDKLSRRAFPRGYTESLEERVRALETEVRELKDLLDEKDEKIDMLSRLHSHGSRRRGSITSQSSGAVALVNDRGSEEAPAKEDTFRVQASPLLLGVENSDSFFMGPSSGRTFIEIFKRRIQEAGKACSDFNPEAFLHIQGTPPLITDDSVPESSRAPPRLFSDRCVNVYFQEWAPLFPILHKPTFLRIYEEFASDPAKIKSNYKTAQLYLVFSIAGISQDSPDLPVLAACEQQWTEALDSLLLENTMNTLQCLLLALIYCTMRADYKRLQHYKGIAISLSHRLGLHQSQKRFSFGALTIETRKKVFWSLYTLDCFTAATLGLPKLLKEEDVQAEYPSDTDDEYVTEKGFQPTLPGESTRLSSALALFRATRILAKVLERNYPASPSTELSLQSMETLETELDDWYENLPSHLRLNFVQDKPSTDVTGSRSPLLALAYYFIRTLIYRPAVGSSLGHKAAPALLSIADSSKHIVQIVQLLEERNMIFSFCLNKSDLLIVCGMTLLYRVIDLKQDGKLMRDDQRLVNAAIKVIERSKAPGWWDFKRIAGRLITLDEPTTCTGDRRQSTTSREPSTGASRSPTSTHSRKKSQSPYINGRRPDAAASENDLLQQQERLRRMTMPNLDGQRPAVYRSVSRQSFDSLPPEPTWQAQTPNRQPTHPNLDYLSLGNTPSQSRQSSPPRNRMHPPSLPQHRQSMAYATSKGPTTLANSADWEVMLGTMDNGLNNVYDAIYGGPGFVNEASVPAQPQNHQHHQDWSPDSWDLSHFSIGEFAGANTAGSTCAPAPQSVLSLSDESLSSGEDVAPSELGLSMGSVPDYQGGILTGNGEGFILEGLDGFPL